MIRNSRFAVRGAGYGVRGTRFAVHGSRFGVCGLQCWLTAKKVRVSLRLRSGGKEVDFLVRTATGAPRLYQVCLDLADPKTRRRELSALAKGRGGTGSD